MTTNELLTPRYECIARCPFMSDKIGIQTILHSATIDESQWDDSYQYSIYSDKKKINAMFGFDQPLSAFPANFRRMHWSEGRSVEDMPEYVNAFGDILKIEKWATMHGVIIGKKAQRNLEYLTAKNCLPATLAEYEAYQNSKQP